MACGICGGQGHNARTHERHAAASVASAPAPAAPMSSPPAPSSGWAVAMFAPCEGRLYEILEWDADGRATCPVCRRRYGTIRIPKGDGTARRLRRHQRGPADLLAAPAVAQAAPEAAEELPEAHALPLASPRSRLRVLRPALSRRTLRAIARGRPSSASRLRPLRAAAAALSGAPVPEFEVWRPTLTLSRATRPSAAPARLTVVQPREVRAPADLFACAKLGTRLSAGSCLARQSAADKVERKTLKPSERVALGSAETYGACARCADGKAVREALEQARPKSPQKGTAA